MKDYQPQIFKIFMAFDTSQIQAFRSNNNDKDSYRVSQINMHPWPFQTRLVHFQEGGEDEKCPTLNGCHIKATYVSSEDIIVL